ncbi:hypothetical protein NC651_001806 [Populus alba x Populus x berolinensis]|nr:hypothetical protein NC651_001806 [Populus alba x Populus x berolinensis]
MEERNEMKWGWRWGSRMGTEAGVCEHCWIPFARDTLSPRAVSSAWHRRVSCAALGHARCCSAGLVRNLVWLHLGLDCRVLQGWRNICSASRAWLSGWSICFHFVARGCRLATLAWDVTVEFQRGGLL